jgi:hypothetical protein
MTGGQLLIGLCHRIRTCRWQAKCHEQCSAVYLPMGASTVPVLSAVSAMVTTTLGGRALVVAKDLGRAAQTRPAAAER